MLLKRVVTGTLFLKASSLIIGFLLWSIISDACSAHIWISVPLCFYNKGTYQINAPESLLVEFKARRSYLRHLDKKNLAIHIDGQTLRKGPNCIEITNDLMFLPPTILLGDTIPHNIVITVQDIES